MSKASNRMILNRKVITREIKISMKVKKYLVYQLRRQRENKNREPTRKRLKGCAKQTFSSENSKRSSKSHHNSARKKIENGF